MKPEHGWTKQHEEYLCIDPSLKPEYGKSAGFHVSLPGKGSEVVRAPVPALHKDVPGLRSQAPLEAAGSTDVGSKTLVIKLPKKVVKETPKAKPPIIQPEPDSFTIFFWMSQRRHLW